MPEPRKKLRTRAKARARAKEKKARKEESEDRPHSQASLSNVFTILNTKSMSFKIKFIGFKSIEKV